MSPELITAIIAAVTSLIVSTAGYFFQQREVRKRLDRMFTDRLYNMRLECYPPAFDITDRVVPRPKPDGIVPREKLLEVRTDLVLWKKGVVNIAISSRSLISYRDLVKVLGMGYGDNTRYSVKQVEKIFRCKAEFRRSLRADLGYLYSEERPTTIIQRTKQKFGS